MSGDATTFGTSSSSSEYQSNGIGETAMTTLVRYNIQSLRCRIGTSPFFPPLKESGETNGINSVQQRSEEKAIISYPINRKVFDDQFCFFPGDLCEIGNPHHTFFDRMGMVNRALVIVSQIREWLELCFLPGCW